MPDLLGRWLRLLSFRATAADHEQLGRRALAAGLVATWLVGMGRYWDDPGGHALASGAIRARPRR